MRAAHPAGDERLYSLFFTAETAKDLCGRFFAPVKAFSDLGFPATWARAATHGLKGGFDCGRIRRAEGLIRENHSPGAVICGSDNCKLQMMGSDAPHKKAIAQKAPAPNWANNQPDTMVNNAVVPPIPTVP